MCIQFVKLSTNFFQILTSTTSLPSPCLFHIMSMSKSSENAMNQSAVSAVPLPHGAILPQMVKCLQLLDHVFAPFDQIPYLLLVLHLPVPGERVLQPLVEPQGAPRVLIAHVVELQASGNPSLRKCLEMEGNGDPPSCTA